MSLRFDDASDFIFTSGSLPAMTNISACGWIKQDVVTVNQYATFWFFSNNETSDQSMNWVGFAFDGVTPAYFVKRSDADGVELHPDYTDISSWFFIGYAKNGLNIDVYTKGLNDKKLTKTSTVAISEPDNIVVFKIAQDQYGENFNGHIAALKIWENTTLTENQMLNESHSYMPKYWNDLWLWRPMLNIVDDPTDLRGKNQVLTYNGNITTEFGPPISWK